MKAAARRGFTLIEVCVVVGIIAVVASIAYPRFDELRRRSNANAATRKLVGSLREARALAIARPDYNGTRAVVIGIRIDSATRYSQIYDTDTNETNNNDVVVRTVDLVANERAPGLTITAPTAGTVIRFRRDGSTTARSITLADSQSALRRTIRLTAGGQASME